MLTTMLLLTLIVVLVVWILPRTLALAARSIPLGVWIAVGVLAGIVAALPMPALAEAAPFGYSPNPPSPVSAAAFLLVILPLSAASILVGAGLRLRSSNTTNGRVSSAFAAATAIVLLGESLANLYGLALWDSTYDPLGYFWLAIPFVACLTFGFLLARLLPGRGNLAAGYTCLLLAAMIVVSWRAQSIDFRRLTEIRAGQVADALEAYHARQGRYPIDLAELTPWTLLTIPEPLILYGQAWCYDSGPGYYRLGYVNRDHWSDPRVDSRLARSAGPPTGLPPVCESQIAELKSRYTGLSDEVVEDYTG